MKLIHLTDEEELRALKCKYTGDPLFLFIWHSIEFELEKLFPNTSLFLYSYRSAESLLLIGYKKNRITTDTILLYQCGDFEVKEVNEAFTQLCGLRQLPNDFMFIGEEFLTETAASFFMARTFVVRRYPTKLFYMTSEQMNAIQSLPMPALPNGYEIGSADPVADAEVITKTWIHSGPNEEEQTEAKLRSFPSTCVRFNGIPVGFEMADHIGALNHLFVFEQHRNKGFGNIIELDLARKMIRKGLKVFKCVELYNTTVLSGSSRSPHWTTAVDVNGEDIILMFMDVTKP